MKIDIIEEDNNEVGISIEEDITVLRENLYDLEKELIHIFEKYRI